MMLDGGQSTLLLCGDASHITSDRTLPQALGTAAEAVPAWSATVAKCPSWPILIEGDSLFVEIEVKNTGTAVWRQDACQLVNETNPWGAEETLQIPQDAVPGTTLSFSWHTDPFPKWGVFPTRWRMVCGGEPFPGEPIEFRVLVLPQELEDRKLELEAEVRQWTEENLANIEELVLEWVSEQLRGFCPLASILPILALAVSRTRKRRE
jgi:hypothetical protein